MDMDNENPLTELWVAITAAERSRWLGNTCNVVRRAGEKHQEVKQAHTGSPISS